MPAPVNPYTTQSLPYSSPLFVGRQAEIEDILFFLQSPSPFNVITVSGPYGLGKSSLVNQIIGRARESGILPVPLRLPVLSDGDEPESLRSGPEIFHQAWVAATGQEAPPGILLGPLPVELQNGPTAQRFDRAVLILEDWENVPALIAGRKRAADFYPQLVQLVSSPLVGLLMTGMRPLKQAAGELWQSLLDPAGEFRGHEIRLGVLEDNDVIRLAESLLDLRLDGPANKRMLRLVGGYPILTQEFLWHLANVLEARKYVTLEDVREAEKRTVEMSAPLLDGLWARLSRAEQRVVLAVYFLTERRRFGFEAGHIDPAADTEWHERPSVTDVLDEADHQSNPEIEATITSTARGDHRIERLRAALAELGQLSHEARKAVGRLGKRAGEGNRLLRVASRTLASADPQVPGVVRFWQGVANAQEFTQLARFVDLARDAAQYAHALLQGHETQGLDEAMRILRHNWLDVADDHRTVRIASGLLYAFIQRNWAGGLAWQRGRTQ